MLRGHHKASIDNKGRLKVPATFRRVLEEKFSTEFFITSVTGESAWLYPLSSWEEVEARLSTLPMMDPQKMKFMDRTNYFGKQASMDAQGRILIQPELRDRADLSGEVSVLGYLDHLEVWNTERFEQRLDKELYTREDGTSLAQLGI